MKSVLVELFKKLVVYFLFIFIVFVVTYSVITGEFPPKLSKIKSAITDIKQQIDQIKKLQQAASDKLLAQDINMDTQIEANNQTMKTIEKAFVETSKASTVSNEHYLKIYNELQSIKGQLGNIENRLYRIEQSGQKDNQRPYPVVK